MNLPTSGMLFLNQTISAAGLESDTLQLISRFSFSFLSILDPEWCPINSIFFGGTETIRIVFHEFSSDIIRKLLNT